MHYGSWKIDDFITLLATTKVYATGAAIDADAAPTYRIYEADIETAILTGTFTVWSDANTVGFYRARVQLTAANGFERGKTYSIYIESIVSGVTTAQHATVQIAAAADIAYVGADATASDNLKLQYNTTGLTGDTFPSTQAQLNQIALTGAAINTAAESYVLAVGVQSSGTVSDTVALDGVYHQHTDVAGEMDLYYQYDVGGDGVPTSVTFTGYLTGNNDNLKVYAYNWAGATWDQIGTLVGKASTVNEVNTYDLFTSHVGSGANLGKVRIRFWDDDFTLTTATLGIDQMFVSYAVVSRSVGYANGAIWINTGASNTNTEPYIDGVADNPVSTLAAALTLSGSTGLNRFEVAQGSSMTFVSTMDGYDFRGIDYIVDLNTQQVSGTTISGAILTGEATGNGGSLLMVDCKLGNITIPDDTALIHCAWAGTVTLSEAGDYTFEDNFSVVAGVLTPCLDVGVAVGDTNVNIRHHSGGIQLDNLGQAGTDTMSIEGTGQIVLGASCVGGTLAVRGEFTVTDNAAGAVTLSEDARIDQGQILKAITSDSTQIVGVQLNAHTAITPASDGDMTTLTALVAAAQVDLDTLTDPYAQPGIGAPPASAALMDMIAYLYKNWRNKKTQTATAYTLFNDDTTTPDQQATVSEVAGTATKGEMASG